MGEVCIATGLVYDLACHFKQANKGKSQSIKHIINNFLKMNGSVLSVLQFKELEQYTSLDKIEAAYSGRRESEIVKDPVKEERAMTNVLERMSRADNRQKA